MDQSPYSAASDVATEASWHTPFGVMILFLSACGVIINGSALVILNRGRGGVRRRRSMFHRLLCVLSVYDVIVVVCSAVLFGANMVVWGDGGGGGTEQMPTTFLKMKVGKDICRLKHIFFEHFVPCLH